MISLNLAVSTSTHCIATSRITIRFNELIRGEQVGVDITSWRNRSMPANLSRRFAWGGLQVYDAAYANLSRCEEACRRRTYTYPYSA